MFTPLITERLMLRPVRQSDTDALFIRRGDPRVAELQDWEMPYTRERADATIAACMETDEPPEVGWWMLTITDLDDEVIFGDIVFNFGNGGRTAEVGYNLGPDHWGKGIATAALATLVDWIFDVRGISRLEARLHPDNHRSARVLENAGFVFEGHLQNACWVGEENSDDLVYGLTPKRRSDWNNRPRNAPGTIELVEPYPIGLRDVLKLAPHRSQEQFVSSIATSLAQVAVPPPEQGFDDDPDGPRVVPWPRIIHADGEAVGFVMMAQPTALNPEPYLWRLLIDRRHQRRGIGKHVIEMVIEQARDWGSESLAVSWVPGVGSPEPLYRAMGFVPTGEIDDGETVARLVL